jgi:RNA polymerase sigma factor (sigma-70 family)
MSDKELNITFINLRPELYQVARRMTNNRDLALDLVQDTYLRVYKYKQRLSEYENIKAGVITMMKHIFINDYRVSQRLPQIDHSKELCNITRADYLTPDVIYYAKELDCLISSLKGVFSDSLKMMISGYSYSEISEVLNIPVGTIKSQIFRSRKTLINKLKP